MTLCIMQGHLVLNKFSDCLNFWILFFKFSSPARLQTAPTGPGGSRLQTAPTGPGGPKSDEKPKTK